MTNVDWTFTWTTVQGISAAVATLIVGLAAWYAHHQLEEATRSRYAQVLDKIHSILGDPAVAAARQTVKELPADFDIASLTKEQKVQIELVTRSFDRAGFYLWCKLIPKEYLLPEYPGAIWHWRKLKHYLNYNAKRKAMRREDSLSTWPWRQKNSGGTMAFQCKLV